MGGTSEESAHFDKNTLEELGVACSVEGTMPDMVAYHEAKSRLVLIEAVTSHGPIDSRRRHELSELFEGARAKLVFVTAALTRRDLAKYVADIAWGTAVWVADSPTHLIHFNGERFLGPFESPSTVARARTTRSSPRRT